MRRTVIALVLVAFSLGVASVGFCADKLNVGDPAPAIKVGRWVKGEPISKIDPDRNYVFEFWATWCGPCRQSIPHLTELAKKYKDKITFAGVSVWERGDVPKFVKDMGSKMDYNVATDSSDKFMATNWMEAAGESGIPAAFVVSKGKIVWIGHPMGGLEDVLEKLIAGKCDVAAYANERRKEKADEVAREQLLTQIDKLVQDGKAQDAVAKLDAYTSGDPEREGSTLPVRVKLLLLADEPAGYKYIQKIADEKVSKNPNALIWLADQILSTDKLKNPDYKLVQSLADRSVELTKGEDPYALYVQSQAYDKNGDTAKALASAEKALSIAQADKKQPAEIIDAYKEQLAALKGKKK